MIQKLQSLKARKGFTMVELIVVIAILAVLMAILVPMLTTKKARIQEANTTARDFYTALQSIMTKYSLYEGPLSPAFSDNPNLGDIRYYENMKGNYPYKKGVTVNDGDLPKTTSLYLELKLKNNQIEEVYTCATVSGDPNFDAGGGLQTLCVRTAGNRNTEFANVLSKELKGRISYIDGYYYAKVTYKNILTGTIPAKMEAETVKVDYTTFSRHRLPNASGYSAFRDMNMYFVDDYVLKNGDVMGVCTSSLDTNGLLIGMPGTYLN